MKTRIILLLGLFIPVLIFSQNVKKGFQHLNDGKYTEARVIFTQAQSNSGSQSPAYYGLAKIATIKTILGYDMFGAFSLIEKSKQTYGKMNSRVFSKIKMYFNEEELAKEHQRIDDLLLEYLKEQQNLSLVERYLKECKTSSHYDKVLAFVTELAFKDASKFDSEFAYREFIKNYPDSKEVENAKTRINELAWLKAIETDNIESYTSFIEDYPDAIQVDSAKVNLRGIEYQKALLLNTDEAFALFINKYPDSQESAELKEKREKLAYDKAKLFGAFNVYQAFIEKFPQSKYTPEIIQYRDSLAFLEAQKINTDKAYVSFVNNYPNSKQVPQTMAILGNMSFSKTELAQMRAKNRIKELGIKSFTAYRMNHEKSADLIVEERVDYDEYGNIIKHMSQPSVGHKSLVENTYDEKGRRLIVKKTFINDQLQRDCKFTYFNQGLIQTHAVKCYFDCNKYPTTYISEYSYNKSRYLTHITDSSLIDSTIIATRHFKYNSRDLLTLEDINFSDTTNSSTTYKYDGGGRMMERSVSDQDGKVLEVESFTYNQEGQKIGKKKFDKYGTLIHKYIYDEKGVLIKEEINIDSVSELLRLTYRYEYFQE